MLLPHSKARKHQKWYTSVTLQTYLYHGRTAVTWILRVSNWQRRSIVDDTGGSTGGESIVNPKQTAGCADGTSGMHVDLCFLFADRLLEES
jgi:Ethanolamine utilization protein EutJ (predicted chaperonin)